MRQEGEYRVMNFHAVTRPWLTYDGIWYLVVIGGGYESQETLPRDEGDLCRWGSGERNVLRIRRLLKQKS